MRRIIPFVAVLLMMAAPSCRHESVPGEDPLSEDKYALSFICDDLQTKSAESEGLPQERVLNSIDVYFYRDGEISSDAVYHTRLNLQDTYTRYNAHIDFLASEVGDLFRSSATCEVFAIANVPANSVPGNVTDDLTGSSMPTLMAKKVQSTFGSAEGVNHIPSSFVMTGYNTITLTSRAKTTVASGLVPLYRLAAKLELLVHVQDTIHLRTKYKDEFNNEYIAEEVWRPMTSRSPGGLAQVEGYLENGYKEAELGVQQDPANHMVQISTTTPMTPALLEMFFKYSKNKMPYDNQTTVTIQEPRRYTYSDFQAGNCTLAQVGQEVAGETVNTVYMYSDPSYTYPVTWSRGVEKEPFYKLCLPWAREGYLLVYRNGLNNAPVQVSYNTAQKQYYYKVIFPVHTLESNVFYRMKMNVAILGSETDDALVELVPTYAVAGWQNKTEILEEAEVGNARFLSVPQSAYTLYNEPTLTIPYVTSDDCEIVNISWIKPYYGTGNTGQNDASGNRISDGSAYGYPKITSGTVTLNSTGASADGKWEFKLSGDKKIAFKHTLSNTQSTTMDVSPYIITFTIRHADAHSYFKTITLTQYPAIYMSQKTGGDVFIDGYFGNVNNGGYSNNYQTHNYGNGYTMTPYRTITRNRQNSDQLTRITVTAFSSDYYSFNSHSGVISYIIGDPRVSSGWSNNDLIAYGSLNGAPQNGSNTVTTNNWGDKAGQIMVGTSEPQLIAPSIYIGSFWAAMNANDPITFDQAKKRCATYQEAGYPAGRWRLPTEAEVNYIQSLQTNGHINTLFNEDYHYWTSSGYGYRGRDDNYKANGNNVTDPGVRCVYDVWYWGDTPLSTTTYHPNPE